MPEQTELGQAQLRLLEAAESLASAGQSDDNSIAFIEHSQFDELRDAASDIRRLLGSSPSDRRGEK